MGRYQIARLRNLTVEQVGGIVVRHRHGHIHSLTEVVFLLGGGILLRGEPLGDGVGSHWQVRVVRKQILVTFDDHLL